MGQLTWARLPCRARRRIPRYRRRAARTAGHHDLRIPGILRGQAAELHPGRGVTGLTQRARPSTLR